MNLKQIRKAFPDQWVLIEFDTESDLDKNLDVRRGKVFFNSKSKKAIYKILATTAGRNLTIEYTGKPPVNAAYLM